MLLVCIPFYSFFIRIHGFLLLISSEISLHSINADDDDGGGDGGGGKIVVASIRSRRKFTVLLEWNFSRQ